MLARLLPIFALLVLAVVGFQLYSSGSLTKILRPTILVAEMQRQVIEGQPIRATHISLREAPLSQVPAGALTWPSGTSLEDAFRTVSGQNFAREVPSGTVLLGNMFGTSSAVVVLRSINDIEEGEGLSLSNVEAVTLEIAPPSGAVVFGTEEEALIYINEAYEMEAAREIFAGKVITLDDTAAESGSVFVLRLMRDIDRSERLNIADLRVEEVPVEELSSGAVTFPTRIAAEAFVTVSDRFFASESVSRDDLLTAQILGSNIGDETVIDTSLPQTFEELTSYMRAYPDRAELIGAGNYVSLRDGTPQEGEEFSLWVESSRTSGAFGEIRFERVQRGMPIRTVFDDRIQPAAEGSGEEDVIVRETFYWVELESGVKDSMNAAKSSANLVFFVREGENLVDILGNGSTCLDNLCQVNREASEDLKHLTETLTASSGAPGSVAGAEGDPLTVIDGVSPELAQRLVDNGYDSFKIIAQWQDAEIPAVTIRLDITNNLAVYIRQQARVLVALAEEAAAELGFSEIPTE